MTKQKQSIFKRFRVRHKLTQLQLAKLLKIKQATVSAWEAGDRFPSRKNAKKFVDLATEMGEDITINTVYK